MVVLHLLIWWYVSCPKASRTPVTVYLVPVRYLSTLWVSVLLGTAPMMVSIFLPSLNIMTVGIDLMPYSVATPANNIQCKKLEVMSHHS